METKLHRIAKKASADKDCQFTSLYHLINNALLQECFTQLKGKAASDIDNITKAEYAVNLKPIGLDSIDIKSSRLRQFNRG